MSVSNVLRRNSLGFYPFPSQCMPGCSSSQSSHFLLFVTPWTEASQAPLSMGFSRQEYWSGLPFPSLGYLPGPGTEPTSPVLAGGFFTDEPPGKPHLPNTQLRSGLMTENILSLKRTRGESEKFLLSQLCPAGTSGHPASGGDSRMISAPLLSVPSQNSCHVRT